MNVRLFNRRRGYHGFVLLEVMIALTIFAVVSLGLVTALNESFRTAEDRNVADQVARGLRNQLAMLRSTPVATGTRELPDDGSGITYSLQVDPEPMIDQKKQPVLGVFRATIVAQWKRDGQVQKQQVSELVYQP